MDIISHALWTNLVFKELPQKNWAVLFGVLPDIISFVRIMGKNFFKKTMHFTDPPKSAFPPLVYKLYSATHSLMVWMGVFVALEIFGFKFWAIAFCGWGLHILLDIFTHTSNFFPTPILWPFSKFHFSGISWSNKWFMMFNYLVLAFLYIIFYFQ